MKQVWTHTLELLNRHRVPSLVLIVWIMGLVSYVVYQVFHDVKLINAAVNGALATVFALPALAVGLMKWRSGKGNGDDSDTTP